MNKQEFAQFAMALKTFYSKENILPNDAAMQLWFNQLADIDYKDAELFLNKWVAVEKWSPAIADIRAGVAEIRFGAVDDWGKGWEQIEKAIRYFGYTRVEEAYESMDEITRECAKRLGFANICASENIQADRANFRMIYEQIAQRKKTERQMNPDTLKLIQKRMEKLADNGGIKYIEQIN